MHWPRLLPRPARHTVALLLVASVSLASQPLLGAAPAGFSEGISVVVSPATLGRTASLSSGNSMLLYVVLEEADFFGTGGVRSFQFHVEVDPRLEIEARIPATGAGIVNNPAVDDWQVGMLDCIPGTQPFVLATYAVRLPSEVTDTADLRVTVRGLENGEPMLYGPCFFPERLERLVNAGGVLLNPSTPSVVYLSGKPEVLVEGHDLELAWETFGAIGTTLNGAAVSPNGSVTLQPLVDTTFELEVTQLGPVASATFDVDVIREPRIDYFTASLLGSGEDLKARLAWDVRGSAQVHVSDIGDVHHRSAALLDVPPSPVWTLTATNEWGTSTAGASLEGFENEPPFILVFAAEPNPFAPGDDVALNYALFNTTSAAIAPGVGSINPTTGTIVVQPTASTVYTLTATNANGTATRDLQVELPPPAIPHFEAAPNPFSTPGDDVILSYTTIRASSATLSPGIGPVNPQGGTVTVQPQETTVYTLEVTNATGTTERNVLVQLRPPGIDLFEADPPEVFAGRSTTLRWAARSGLNLSIAPDVGVLATSTGEVTVTPPADDTAYTLTASNPEGSVTATVIIPWKVPDVTLEGPSTAPYAGETFSVIATIDGADTATLEPGVGPIGLTGGTFEVTAPGPTTFVATATNAQGAATAEVLILPLPPEATLTVSDDSPFASTAVTLTAQIEGALSATIEPGIGAIDPMGGTFQVIPTAATTYTLTVTNPLASVASEVTVTPRPPEVDLTVSDDTPFAGSPVTLTAQIEGAQSATIDPDVGSIDAMGGVFEVTPVALTTYTLTATNPLVASASVTVTPQAPQATLAVSDESPPFGTSVTLTAVIEGALSATIEPGIGAIDPTGGTFEVTPSAVTTYTLTATNPLTSVTSEVTVTASVPAATLTASNENPPAGTSVTLTAVIHGAVSATLEPGFGTIDPAGGTFEVSPTEVTTYSLTATNPVGSVTSEVTITPSLPEVTLTVSDATPFPDETIELTAVVVGASAATLEPGFGSIDPTGGVFTTRVLAETTFVLTATGGLGTTTAEVTVTPQAPNIVSFTTSATQLFPGEDALLSWSVEHANYIEIEPGGYVTTNLDGWLTVQPDADTTYELTATNSAGTSTAQVNVEVDPFAIVRFTATPSTIAVVQDVLLEWEVLGNALVSIDGLGPQPQSGSTIVRPVQTTTYTLRASGGGVNETATTTVTLGVLQAGFIEFSWSGTEFPGQVPSFQAFVPFDFWVVGIDPPAGMEAYEFGVTALPAECWVFTDEEIFPPGATDFGVDSGTFRNYLVGTGGTCIEGTIVPLVRLQMMTFDFDCFSIGTLELGAASPSSFSPARPGYLPCNCPCDIRPFGGGNPIDFGDLTGVTPAVVVQLRLTEEPEGTRVDWSSSTLEAPERLQIRRRESHDNTADEVLVEWSGAQAASRRDYLDGGARVGVAYDYTIAAMMEGTWVESETVTFTRQGQVPRVTRLLDNVPNPFNPRTEIRYTLARATTPVLEIYDSGGRRIRSVRLGLQSAGEHGWTWHGDDDSGRGVTSGVYHVRLSALGENDVRTVTLVR